MFEPHVYYIQQVWSYMPYFYGWLRTTYVLPGLSLMEFIVNSLVVSAFVYMILGNLYDE